MTRPPGAIVWLTGPPASGKTTAAVALLERLRQAGAVTLWLDSDEMRLVLTPRPTYTDWERDDFYAALGHIAVLSAQGGAIAVVSATASRARWRDAAREQTPRFCEVLLTADPTILRARDFKGLYAKADRGEITTLPGVGAPYEPPEHPELVFDTATATAGEVADAVMAWLGA